MSIHLLPSELLIDIFAFATEQENLAPLRLRCICKWWKRIVDDTPRIWQRLLLNDDLASSRARATLWRERSQPLGFDIDLHINDPDMLLSHLSPLFDSIDRWHNLSLYGAMNLQFNGIRLSTSTLQTLSIDYGSEAELLGETVDGAPSAPPKTIFTPCSNKPHSYTMNLTMTELPEARLLVPLHFTHLELNERHFSHNHTHPSHILSFLTMLPALQSLTFTGSPSEDEPFDDQYPIVHLPDLHTLKLRNTCSVRAILSHLYVPRLRVLYLYHLNVDFPLSQSAAGITIPEPGESADEADDFSQSPWSDLSIGMGLRSLITRCNPPIRVLEMDYSDMRTKDFRFIFERLNTLQEFMIVASDMSDNVINLFKPYRQRPKEGQCIEDLVIRLPLLNRLELFNCQQLTGEAIVDAIGTRTAHTDRYSPDCTLTEVSIVNCERFMPHHGHTLSKVLGSRLRLE